MRRAPVDLERSTRSVVGSKKEKTMLEYENRLGKVYHFRAKKTKLGKVTYVASTKASPDDIERIPRGYEIY